MKMKPSLDKLSEDMEKGRKEQESIRENLLSIREKELLQLREQVSNIKANLLQALAVGAGVVFVLAAFGITAWFWKLPAKIDEVVTALPQRINEVLQPEVRGQVEAAREQILANMNDKMDDVVYANGDFQDSLEEYRKGEINLAELREIVKDRLRNEIVVSLYTDILLDREVYPSACELLEDLKENDIFPAKYKRCEMYTQAGVIQWIMSLNEPSRHRAERMTRDARQWLEEAVKKGRDRHSKTLTRIPLKWLIFLHLSQGNEPLAIDRAKQYKSLGGDGAQLSSQTQRKWFADLNTKRGLMESGLNKVMADVFDEHKSAVNSK
jgi:hypothetical protein